MGERAYRVALIPGDGIGKEVVPAARLVIDAVGQRFRFASDWTDFDWSCELHSRTGSMTGGRSIEELADQDAIFLGAIGYPGVPDHVSLWGLLIPIRRRFAQYVNLRPVRLLPGVRTPLADRGPEDIDLRLAVDSVCREGPGSGIHKRCCEAAIPFEFAGRHCGVVKRG